MANTKLLGVPRAQGEIILVTDASNVGGIGTLFQWLVGVKLSQMAKCFLQVLPAPFYRRSCKWGSYRPLSLAKRVTSERTVLDKKSETLPKLRVSAAITKVALSYLKGRKKVHHATTRTVCTQDKMAQRESEQLERVPYRNKGSYGNPGPSP